MPLANKEIGKILGDISHIYQYKNGKQRFRAMAYDKASKVISNLQDDIRTYEDSSETDRVDPGATVGDIKATHVSGVLEIQPFYRIADVEKEFMERFGLSVQILRKEKNKWEQTTGMDDFTLTELNEFGRSSSDELIVSEYDEKFKEIDDKPEKLY